MTTNHRPPAAFSLHALNLPHIEPIAAAGDRLAPRVPSPLPARPFHELSASELSLYIGKLAGAIIKQGRTQVAQSTLKDVERLFRLLDNRAAAGADEQSALSEIRIRGNKAHNAWRRKHLDDVTTFIVCNRMGATHSRKEFGVMAEFFAALVKQLDIKSKLTEWTPVPRTHR